jgi:hypothetical protein
MYEFSRAGYSTVKKKVITEKGEFVIENLSPDKKDDRKLKAAEAELYSVFSKYCSESEKKG